MIELTPKPGSNNALSQPMPQQQGPVRSEASQTSASSNSIAATTIINLLKQLPQAQTIAAQVKSIQTLNASEKTLLQQVNPTLVSKLSSKPTSELNQQLSADAKQTSAQLSVKSATPSLSSLTISNPLVDKTTLYLAKLLVSSNSGKAQLLTTVTTQALKVNETVLLGERNQQLVIDKLPSQKIQQTAVDLIKQILPKQQSVSQLQQFITQVSQIPAPIQSKLLNEAVIQAVRQLLTFTHTEKSLQQGEQVKQALNHSGIQLESKIARGQSITQDIRTTLDKIISSFNHLQGKVVSNSINNNPINRSALNNSAVQGNTHQNQTNNTQGNHQKTASAIGNTQPAITGFTSKELEKLLTNLLPSQSASSAVNPTSTQATTPLPAATAALFRLLGFQLPSENSAITPLPKIIEQHLKKLVEQTQAKIQLNQLRSLGLDKPAAEGRTSLPQQFYTELPLRFNEQTLPLQINIQEKEYSEEDNKDQLDTKTEEKKPKNRQWQIFMSFDLPNDEKLHTQVNIIENSVSATLWAESSLLCQKARQEINTLRDKLLANGLNVDDLSCIHGTPPQQDFSLDYNLVDIKT